MELLYICTCIYSIEEMQDHNAHSSYVSRHHADLKRTALAAQLIKMFYYHMYNGQSLFNTTAMTGTLNYMHVKRLYKQTWPQKAEMTYYDNTNTPTHLHCLTHSPK